MTALSEEVHESGSIAAWNYNTERMHESGEHKDAASCACAAKNMRFSQVQLEKRGTLTAWFTSGSKPPSSLKRGW